METMVGPADTALSLLERVSASTNTFCFPDRKLFFNGQVLPSGQRIASCGIKEGEALELTFQASDDTLAKQLSDLLGDKAMTAEELGLLYIHRHLVSVQDALEVLGHPNCKLQTFLADQKHFCLEGGLVKVSKLSLVLEVRVGIELHVPGKAPEHLCCEEGDQQVLRLDASESVAKAIDVIKASEQMPFLDCNLALAEGNAGPQAGREMPRHLSLRDAGVVNGAILVMVVHASVSSLAAQLEGLLRERVALSPNELSLHYCQRFGTPIGTALRTLGLPGNLKRFLESQPQFSIVRGCVTMVNGPQLEMPPIWEESSTHLQDTEAPQAVAVH